MLDSSEWNTRLRIGVILASTWRARRGEGFANWIRSLLATRPGIEAELIDLRDIRLPEPSWNDPLSAEDRQLSDRAYRQWSKRIDSLDGFVIVIPEYNQVYPGQLRNAIDHVRDAWSYKPIAFVSYEGAPAGTRAVEQLRGIAVATRMVPVPGEVNTRLVAIQASETGRLAEEEFAKSAGSMIDQLLWWAKTAKAGRANHAPPAVVKPVAFRDDFVADVLDGGPASVARIATRRRC